MSNCVSGGTGAQGQIFIALDNFCTVLSYVRHISIPLGAGGRDDHVVSRTRESRRRETEHPPRRRRRRRPGGTKLAPSGTRTVSVPLSRRVMSRAAERWSKSVTWAPGSGRMRRTRLMRAASAVCRTSSLPCPSGRRDRAGTARRGRAAADRVRSVRQQYRRWAPAAWTGADHSRKVPRLLPRADPSTVHGDGLDMSVCAALCRQWRHPSPTTSVNNSAHRAGEFNRRNGPGGTYQ